jgi:hypothetical protein
VNSESKVQTQVMPSATSVVLPPHEGVADPVVVPAWAVVVVEGPVVVVVLVPVVPAWVVVVVEGPVVVLPAADVVDVVESTLGVV